MQSNTETLLGVVVSSQVVNPTFVISFSLLLDPTLNLLILITQMKEEINNK
jgi:hypothetical protein